MPDQPLPLVFDGHNDVLLRLYKKKKPGVERDFIDGDGKGHLDLPRMREGGFGGGMFAIFVPSGESFAAMDKLMQGERYDVPLPRVMQSSDALPVALAMAAILYRIEAAAKGAFRVCRSASDIRAALAEGVVAAVFHIEGAEAIDRDLNALDVLYRAGLRSLGPVWSRPTIFGHGVPFRYPSTGDTGPGLTDLGKALVKACNDLGIVVDLSHLNEKGFWDVAAESRAPLIATHSNAHAICPHARNLTDRQLHAIRDTGGMVGLNFATCFLRPDGQSGTDTPLDTMARHLDHLIANAGLDHVGLGSDFDGAHVPRDIGDVTGLPVLLTFLRHHGYNDDTLRKLAHENWIAVLERTWGA